MKPHRHRKSPPQEPADSDVTPVEAAEEEAYHPEPVPPAVEETYQPSPVPPAQEASEMPNVVPPAQEAPSEQVYDYTQGGDQPAVYEQPSPVPAVDPFAAQSIEEHSPVPVPPAYEEPQPTARSAPAAPIGLSHSTSASPRRRSAVKTSPGGVGAAKRPGYAPGRPGSPAYQPVEKGFSLMSVLMMILAGIMIIVAILVIAPSNMKGIQGYAGGKTNLENKEPKNLLKIGQQVMISDEVATFTETEVNQYLAGRLTGKQSGLFGGAMKLKGVAVDFSPNMAEVYIERTFLGIPVTMSSRIKLIKVGNETRWQSAGGRIGKLNINSEKQFDPVLQAFIRLKQTCNEEVSVINAGTIALKFEKDKIVLDGR